jgi:hypothetical protein
MEFRAGSPADAETIAGLIATFQSELTDDPSGARGKEYFASVSVQAERELGCLVVNRDLGSIKTTFFISNIFNVHVAST